MLWWHISPKSYIIIYDSFRTPKICHYTINFTYKNVEARVALKKYILQDRPSSGNKLGMT